MEKWGLGILISVIAVLSITGVFLSAEEVFAEVPGEPEKLELLIEYTDSYQVFSENEFIPGVEAREKITSQVELWNLEADADMAAVIDQLKENPAVLHVEQNLSRQLFVSVNDPYVTQQWWLPHVKPQAIWSRTGEQRKSTVVAVIDTGIASDHEDLTGRVQAGGYNFYGNNTNVNDVHGHGTMVSGVITASSSNGIGISGVAGTYDIKVLPLKVSHLDGRSSVSNVVRAIDYAVSKKADVINLSLGSSESSAIENEAIQRAIQEGITVVASAGNDALKGNSKMYPASYQNVISVGAVDRQNERASFSNYNSSVSLAAPGTEVYTTDLYNRYAQVNGTSFSAPIVAGTAAVMKALQPDLAPRQLKELLEETTTDLGSPGKDVHFGAGLLNMEQLNSNLKSSNPHVSVSSVELNTSQLTIDLDQSKRSADAGLAEVDELETIRRHAAIEFEREPNDSFVSANRLTPGNSMVGTINRYYFDVDHYRVTLESPGKFSFLAGWIESRYVSHKENNYLRIGVYNEQQQLIDVARLNRLSNGETVMFYSNDLPKGTYYLVVLQSSPYQYLFVDEEYMITSIFTPASIPEPMPQPKPDFAFDRAFMEVGQTDRFVANMEKAGVLTSSDPQVAVTDASGMVRAIGHGSAMIRYTSNTTSKTAQVKVTRQTDKATAVLFEKVLPANATEQAVTWTSSNPSVAEVDEYGIITGKLPGTATITVKTKDGGRTANAIVTVKGKELPPEFNGDFPDIQADTGKIFTVTFNQALQAGKDYSEDILISRSSDGKNRITDFTATVDAATPTKLYITPKTKWEEGAHYLTVKKNLQNKNFNSLAKDFRIKFDVINKKASNVQEAKEYERYMDMLE